MNTTVVLSDNANATQEETLTRNGVNMDNPIIERALRRLKESQISDNHVSHYTKHSSYSTKHSSTW